MPTKHEVAISIFPLLKGMKGWVMSRTIVNVELALKKNHVPLKYVLALALYETTLRHLHLEGGK